MKEISWQEFSYLVAGLGPDTPLGRIVAIRAETDPDTLRGFSPEMRKIRNEWLAKRARDKDQTDVDRFLSEMLAGFKTMAGGRRSASGEG